MSLDFSLYQVIEEEEVEEFEFGITHNLTEMADKLGVYDVLWHPEDFPVVKAKYMIPKLTHAIIELTINPDAYRQYEPSNKWGTVESFLDALRIIRAACEKFPEATPKAYT